MKNRWSYLLLGGALLLGTSGLRAQEPPPGPPPDALLAGPEGPIAQRIELLGFDDMLPGKAVTGAPYSAVAVTEKKQTLADGNTIEHKIESNVYRDSQGRTRRETTFAGIGPLAASGHPHSLVMIHDPVASMGYVLHPDTKTAQQLPPHPGKLKGALRGKFQTHFQKQVANGNIKKEDLGLQTINGMSAQGTRYTHTIPAGQIGNALPITVTSEQWYSPDLQAVVKSVRNDPRFGETTYTLTNIQRTEPAASLFTVPSDYTVTKGNMLYRSRGPHGGAVAIPEDAPPPSPEE